MSENRPFDPSDAENPGRHSPEFEPASYPDKVAGRALPSLDGQVGAVEIEDVWGDSNSVEGIPLGAIRNLNMPRLGPNVPDEARAPFEAGIGLALVACRKEELDGEDPDDRESPVRVFVPTTSGDVEMVVRRKTLARKV